MYAFIIMNVKYYLFKILNRHSIFIYLYRLYVERMYVLPYLLQPALWTFIQEINIYIFVSLEKS